LLEPEIEYYEKQYETMNYRLSDKLHDPKKLIEIAQMGAADPELATNAFAELLHQCYNSDNF